MSNGIEAAIRNINSKVLNEFIQDAIYLENFINVCI